MSLDFNKRHALIQLVAEREEDKVGTVHRWADGHDYKKQADGSWQQVPGKPSASSFKARTVTKSQPAVAPAAKAAPEKATPEKLPDDLYRYFKKTADSKIIPVSALKTIRARPEGIKNAAVHMANAFNGEGEKRKPISLKDNGDGSYTVMDGNSTTNLAQQHKWKNIVATVSTGDEPAHEWVQGADLPLLVDALRDFLSEVSFKAGTIRKWGGFEFQKQADTTWSRLPTGGGGGGAAAAIHRFTKPAAGAAAEKPKAASPAAPKAVIAVDVPEVPGFADAVKAGKLAAGKTVEQHVGIARAFLGKHAASLDKSISNLKGVMPKGVDVKGRTKAIDSALGKLVRKPKYGTVEKLQDGTGMRVIAKDNETLEASVAALKKNYKIIESDDYVSKPLGGETGLGYRSFHAIIEDSDGLQKEVQLRTPNQNVHADWCHDVYKPHTPEQEKAMKDEASTIAKYAREMGDYFAKVDAKKTPGEPPPCPPPVKQHFTCL